MDQQATPGDGEPTDRGTTLLEGLSRLAGRGFADRSEATSEILRLITDQFGLRTSFVSRIEPERGELLVVESRNEPGGCDLPAGTTVDLYNTF